MARHRCTGPNLPHPVSAIGLKITLFPVNTVMAIQNKHNLPNNGVNGKKTFRSRTDQGRSCKQICWPPGFDGLQRVGLDPGQYDHHPHGVVHVGQLQDV